MEKSIEIANGVINELQNQCQCNLISNNVITNGGLLCFEESPLYVTYRAQLHGTVEMAAQELISYIEQWLATGPILNVRAQFLSVQSSCTLVITSADEDECTFQTESISEIPTTVEFISSSISTENNDSSGFNTDLIAVIVTVLCIVGVIVIVIFLVVLFVKLRSNSTKKRDLTRDT